MPPKNPKPITPKLRGEAWELYDGRRVVYLAFLGKNEAGRVLEVLNEDGRLESVFGRQFRKRVNPPETEEEQDAKRNKDAPG